MMQAASFYTFVARRATFLLLVAASLFLNSCGDNSNDDAAQETITPLAFAACPNVADAPFQCATATVPLDYSQPNNGQTVQLAVIKHPATNPSQRLGTIFFNPGGPAIAGTDILPRWLSKFPAALVEQFDIVSWDPRGAGRSTAVKCFSSQAEEAAFKSTMAAAYPIGDAQVQSQAVLQNQFNQNCLANAGLALLQHVSTEDTARDLDWLRRASGEQSMNYLGLSYGTLLGATYANLFPKAVRAMVLDGNVDVDGFFDSSASLGTSERINNDTATGQTFNAFIGLCAAAGTTQCAFAQGDAAATMAKFTTLSARLAAAPIALGTISVTQALMLSATTGSLFIVETFDGFPGWSGLGAFLQILWEASGGDSGTEAVTPSSQIDYSSIITTIQEALVTTKAPVPVYESDGSTSAIECGESPNPRVLFSEVAAHAQARAGILGPAVAWFEGPCASWPATAAHIYAGPWNAQTTPILVIGNIFDPSTAYSSSQKMAQKLQNARLLTVNGYGHTVLLNSSACASAAESAYFINGVMPAQGTVCQQDVAPFASP